MAHYAITWRTFSQLMWILDTKLMSARSVQWKNKNLPPPAIYVFVYRPCNFISVTVCVVIYIYNMSLPCKSCTYSYSLGVYLIYTRISIIFQTFCCLYFKSSFLFGDVIENHKPHSFISFKWYIIQRGGLYVYPINYKISFRQIVRLI